MVFTKSFFLSLAILQMHVDGRNLHNPFQVGSASFLKSDREVDKQVPASVLRCRKSLKPRQICVNLNDFGELHYLSSARRGQLSVRGGATLSPDNTHSAVKKKKKAKDFEGQCIAEEGWTAKTCQYRYNLNVHH